MAEEEEEGPKINKANIDDEFLRHPHSGAYIRNPLLETSRSSPILFQDPEFKHNCLEEALSEYNCLTVSEASFREMMRQGSALDKRPPGSPLARAALSTLTRANRDYDFVVSVKKSTYAPPRAGRRRAEQRQGAGTVVDKLNIEVTDDLAGGLRVDDIKEGLIAAWNRRQHPVFQVRAGDRVIKVNGTDPYKATPQQLLSEMEQAGDAVRIVFRRPPTLRSGSQVGAEIAVM
mmetsp:Transcript_26069/g.56552  ORF Transcript_26069/g.56552 Transcript_26069/m.56552 type:complete len:232 (-) Transcript_26069:93-788(-)|eukprot:CAMPEP_0206464808 /NCGR_PEP_ID=MMETSP0324_2-20121206/27439_1 /ASSEMBLY_ACC=CAM_ASM_000836 /TAXON_ID=2866 /ORGANISM="Crypthecodinium cohnii, Strain Seligo" /LENGTH=231 /DNA_ID=CAMNT_0053937515 /DNA_START=39 /DNA_END=734 /DNA_ORIENTATION=-